MDSPSLRSKNNDLGSDDFLLIDSVRIRPQIQALRRGFGSSVVHVHICADQSDLMARYKNRKGKKIREAASYKEAQENPTEAAVDELAEIADVVVNTSRCTPEDVLVRVASRLRLYGRARNPCVDVIIGGQFGSEGKGQVAAYMAPDYNLLIRVGGPNAGHKVYEKPEPTTFHLLPSGTGTCKAKILIGAGAVINVETVLKEIAKYKVDKDRLAIDPQAMIIESQDIEKEVALTEEIGSTGQGVGEATFAEFLGGYMALKWQKMCQSCDTIFVRVGRSSRKCHATRIAGFCWKELRERGSVSIMGIFLTSRRETQLYQDAWPSLGFRQQ